MEAEKCPFCGIGIWAVCTSQIAPLQNYGENVATICSLLKCVS